MISIAKQAPNQRAVKEMVERRSGRFSNEMQSIDHIVITHTHKLRFRFNFYCCTNFMVFFLLFLSIHFYGHTGINRRPESPFDKLSLNSHDLHSIIHLMRRIFIFQTSALHQKPSMGNAKGENI